MKTGMKLSLATGFVGVTALAATMFGQVVSTAQEGTPTSKPSAQQFDKKNLTPEQREAMRAKMAEKRANACGFRGDGKRAGKLSRVVHSETKFQVESGFATKEVDHGTITGVSGQTVTIKRADNQTVSATATDKTLVCRDGKQATTSELKVGDEALIGQVVGSEKAGVHRIAARSPSAA